MPRGEIRSGSAASLQKASVDNVVSEGPDRYDVLRFIVASPERLYGPSTDQRDLASVTGRTPAARSRRNGVSAYGARTQSILDQLVPLAVETIADVYRLAVLDGLVRACLYAQTTIRASHHLESDKLPIRVTLFHDRTGWTNTRANRTGRASISVDLQFPPREGPVEPSPVQHFFPQKINQYLARFTLTSIIATPMACSLRIRTAVCYMFEVRRGTDS